MSKKQTISVPLIADPRGVNVPIQEMQEALSVLPWLEFSYGQARPIITEVEGSRYTMPQVYAGFREFLSMEPDDSSSAFSFFEVTERGSKTHEFSTEWIQPVSLVVYCNLEIINQIESRERDYIFTPELREEVSSIIKGGFAGIDGDTITLERGIENAFSNYSYWTFDEKYIKRNYDAFRLNFDVRFDDRCDILIDLLDPDYQKVINKAISLGWPLPSTAEQQKTSNLIKGLKSVDQWDGIETMGIYINSNSLFSLIDLKDPDNLFTNVNSAAYSFSKGFCIDGVSQYIDSNYIPSELSINTLEMTGISYADRVATTITRAFWGAGTSDNFNRTTIDGTTESNTWIRFRSGIATGNIKTNAYAGTTLVDWEDGILTTYRNGTKINSEFNKSTTIIPITSALPVTLNTNSLTLGASKYNGTVSEYIGLSIKSFWYGNDLDFSLIKPLLEAYEA